MSTPNRLPGRASLPHTPVSTPFSRNRTDSFAEPKSELLRNALDAKRQAHITPTPTPPDTRLAHAETLKSAVSDPWLDNAKNEEDTMKTTPVRRPGRPSEGALPRMRTQRELQAENESLRKAQMDLKLRLEALSDQHNKLRDQNEQYVERIKELEPYAVQVDDLRHANNQLTLKAQDMEDEMSDLRDQNKLILQISEETVAELGQRNEALEEAAELILGLEMGKGDLLEEIEQLKAQATKAQTDVRYNTDACVTANEQPEYPTRVHSIDESRPSTSYNDSDYYSMPASPHGKPSQESMIFVSDRAKKFIDMKKETQRSTKDLSRRLSDASLKQQKKKKEPMPQVPQIPEAYRQQPITPGPNRAPRRVGSLRTTLSPALAYDPYGTNQTGSAPQTPTGGLRAHFQNGLTLDTSSRSSRPTSQRSSATNSPLSNKSKQSTRGRDAPVAPARHSSRAAHTSYSAEQLRSEYKPEEQSDAGKEMTWEVPPSVVSEAQTTEMDANYRGPWYNQISSWGTNNPNITGADARNVHRSTSYTEANFLFNPAENEDEFVEKTRSFGRRR
ncbi:uncharacterized protein N0V89_000321 [Didymosphaeria variabile]|uniref:Centrosomin N-terminal motif 1 domain-containing protein n=1 Tax=Didymosphaeria variabile TaxID=1932322 RepID=A0A9W9CFR7_9PLEO|nr:uncharacterized protein N0V89_000321 [Didymosphaeria variabile]KAJ4359765.1 hypothetical protein N0V89_000321 [Didymosphaeria variabile]